MQGEEGLVLWTCKGDLTNGVIDLVKSSRGSDTKACHVMDQRNTNEEVGQMDEVRHRIQGRRNDEWPQGYH
jgi:hypothetical protein